MIDRHFYLVLGPSVLHVDRLAVGGLPSVLG